MRIKPARRLSGELRLPGDKSISHRAAILAALTPARPEGVSVSNFSTSADCASTLSCLRSLGVRVEGAAPGVVKVWGAGRGPGEWALQEPSGPLDCGNSGTTMRLLAGVVAAQPFAATLTGDASLSRRPMRRVVEPLELMGARVETDGGHAPLRVEGRRPLRAIEYRMPLASAQVKSCVLLAGLGARGVTRVVEAGGATRDHTERLLRWFGVPVHSTPDSQVADGGEGQAVGVEGPAALRVEPSRGEVRVPGDISSAVFFAAAAALLPGSRLTFREVGLNPTRAQFLDVLRRLGVGVECEGQKVLCGEPVGTVSVRSHAASLRTPAGGARLLVSRRSVKEVGCSVAELIDELPALAVVGTRVEGGLEIRDAGELRVKESDRIRATVENLRRMGAEVEEFDDGLRVVGPVRLRGARLDSFGDHRIAMAFAVAALAAEGESEIEGAEECVGVSFPEFFEALERVAER